MDPGPGELEIAAAVLELAQLPVVDLEARGILLVRKIPADRWQEARGAAQERRCPGI